MGDEINPNDKLRMVLDYMPCAPCKEIPSEDQKYLCTICKRLNRTVARKCAYAMETAEPAPAPSVPGIIIQGEKVLLTKEEWDRITSMLGSKPPCDEDKQSGRICISRTQWDEILDKIEQKWQPSQSGFKIQDEEPDIKFSDEASPNSSSQDWEDIEVVVGQPKSSNYFEPIQEVCAEEIKTDQNWTEVIPEDESKPKKYMTGVKVFPAGPNVEQEIRKWAEEHGAVVKSKIPINIRQRQN
ncbi:MAG: hypothetical protein PHH26_05060 [Candidatus Thermoplasmatota archaeon]|nr:hypothetical protein [Candidatus Thermoplasmatota archaeon]